MKLLAHAKLNLYLEVTGKRPNGYHELMSQVVFLDLADEISVTEDDDLKVFCTDSKIVFKDPIILRAALKMSQFAPKKSGAKITFTKNIPVGGGLGGGSADAAVVLVLLNDLWNLNLPQTELYKIGMELGSDVPVCLYSILENTNTAIFKGLGEIVKPAPPIKKAFFVLVNPNIELLTATVFQNFVYIPRNKLTERKNDLQETAIKLVPEISEALKLLKKQNGCKDSSLTGSGATSFGQFYTLETANTAAAKIKAAKPDWFVQAASLKS